MPTKKLLNPDWPRSSSADFAQGIQIGDTIHVSGQVAQAPDGSLVGEGDMQAQARQVFANIEAVLALGGATDSTIADVCRTEDRTNVTFDTDFADIRTYVPAEFNGIVVLRLGNQSKEHLLGVAARLLPTLESQPLRGQLWIVEDSQIRIRGTSED